MVQVKRVLCFVLLLLGAAQSAAYQHASSTDEGVIEQIDRDAGTLVISGYRYSVAVDVRVEINGSYGAFTMLEPGMAVRYRYLLIDAEQRRIVELQEVLAEGGVSEV